MTNLLSHTNSHCPEDSHGNIATFSRSRLLQRGPGLADRVLRRVYLLGFLRSKRDLGEGGEEDHRMRPHHQVLGTPGFLGLRPGSA